jgi:hypothetical protein
MRLLCRLLERSVTARISGNPRWNVVEKQLYDAKLPEERCEPISWLGSGA